MHRPIFLCDMDCTVANYEKALIRDLNIIKSPFETEITVANLWELEKLPHMKARMDLIKTQPDWWFNLEPIYENIEIVRYAQELGFEIHILSKGPRHKPIAWAEKVRWIDKNMPDIHYINLVTDKSCYYGRVLFDDYSDYMRDWLVWRPRGLGIMPPSLNNETFEHAQVVKLKPGSFKDQLSVLESYL